jgi:hypothetical protein
MIFIHLMCITKNEPCRIIKFIHYREQHLKFEMCISLVASAVATRSAISLQERATRVQSTMGRSTLSQ